MVTFYQFPREHWGHLRTVNVVESPFAALQLRTDASTRFKRCDRLSAVIWKMLRVTERRFRLNAPHLLAKVYARVRYVDGVEVTQEVAACRPFTLLLTEPPVRDTLAELCRPAAPVAFAYRRNG